MQDEKNNNNPWRIINVIIIIIIVILLSRCNKLRSSKEINDIFNINFDCKSTDNCQFDKSNLDLKSENDMTGDIFVNDESGNYVYQQSLNIFNNKYFNSNKIAPGVSSIYKFRVNNESNIDTKYYIKMTEISEYNINLKYRLKRNGLYIIGDVNNYVNAEELETTYYELNQNKFDDYELDWKWFDDDLDNLAGSKALEYNLNIRFYFEMVDSE